MTLEIDIIVGMTDDTLKHGSDQDTQKQKEKLFQRRKIDQNASFDMNDQGHSNMQKIRKLEQQMIKFVTIFGRTNHIDENNVNETVMDEQRLRQMEKHERFGLQLFKKDHLF